MGKPFPLGLLGLLCLLLCHVTGAIDCQPDPQDRNAMLCDDGRSYHLSFEEVGDEAHHSSSHTVHNTTGANHTRSVTCERLAPHKLECEGEEFENEEVLRPPNPAFYFYTIIVLLLISGAGMMSGLQMGILSLDLGTLRVLSNAGEPAQKKNAAKIEPLVKRRHLLLVTLLVGNAACLEGLPLFLDKLLDPFVTILVSVTAVLFFGEVIPQAVCVRYGLSIGATLSPAVWGLIAITLPISYPISKLLDYLLGKGETQFFRRGELKEFIELQHRQGEGDKKLTGDEATIIGGALEMSSKTVGCCMTPSKDVFMLPKTTILDKATLKRIRKVGKSRVPIYDGDPSNIVGMILAQDLLGVGPIPVTEFRMHKIPSFYANKSLYECMHEFAKGRSHMAKIHDIDDPSVVVGIVTLDDITQELIKESIADEMDVRQDLGESINAGSMSVSSNQQETATPPPTSSGLEVMGRLNALKIDRPHIRNRANTTESIDHTAVPIQQTTTHRTDPRTSSTRTTLEP